MPVVGHGLTAIAVREGMGEHLVARRFTLLTLALLAYAPDVASQVLALLGVAAPRAWSHSLPLGFLGAMPLTFPVRRALGVSGRAAFLISFGSIVLHDLLDMLQSSDRMLLWPLSMRAFGPAQGIIPASLVGESALFAALALAAWLYARRRGPRAAAGAKRCTGLAGTLLTGVLIVVALGTSWLRDRREADAAAAHWFIEHGEPARGLALLPAAGRWPSPGKPGRIDYLRGAAYNALGNRDAAEHFYLLSLRQDPSYFWTVVDLAMMYADGPGSSAERRSKMAPYMRRLERDFASQAEFAAVSASIAARLARSDAASAPGER
jgi:membrane-bound metal-dependent hydrolase YbcI (DUF457 family)